MMLLLRPTVLLRVAKRTAASNAVCSRGKRTTVAATPLAATKSRGILIHDSRKTPSKSESPSTTKTAATGAAVAGRTVHIGQGKLQRASSTQQKVSTKQRHSSDTINTSSGGSNTNNNIDNGITTTTTTTTTTTGTTSSSSKTVVPTKDGASPGIVALVSNASSFGPDYREKVLQIFQRLSEINNALQERYKAQSYQTAVDNLKRDDYIFLHIPPNIIAPGVDYVRRKKLIEAVHKTPKVGEKLKTKMIEILTTGDLAELHSLQAKPIIRAIQELTQVHGFGPRTAVALYKKYGIKSVAELRQRVKEQEVCNGHSNSTGKQACTKASSKDVDDKDSILHLTEAQRLGLKYHRDISQRIPHEEVRLHEAFLKLRLRKYLGKGYDLSICGSYRRRLPTSGDIDVLITRRTGSHVDAVKHQKNLKGGGNNNNNNNNSNSGSNSRVERVLAPQEVLAAFVEALKQERYIEATLAQGSTKFMGVSRLKSYNYNAGATHPKLYPARRLDIRFVEPECFPAALLYFTGSKNFNVVMRAEAIKRQYTLNEYGLFRNDATNTTCSAHEDPNHNDDNKNEDTAETVSSRRSGSRGSKKGTERARWNAETFQKVLRAQYYSAKSPALGGDDTDDQDHDMDGEGTVGKGHGKKKSNRLPPQELAALWREVEARRVKVKHERDVFTALGMAYVHPEHREL